MVLYLGNMLSRHGKSPALMELVVPRLKEHIRIYAYSQQKRKLVRLINMMLALLQNRKQCSLVLIDTFSTNAFWYCYIISWMCRILRIPYIPVLHGGLFEKRLKSTPQFCQHVFTHSAINISPSLFLKHVFEDYQYKVVHIPNFIELENYPICNRTDFNPNIIWVRAFHEIYNPGMAIRVLELLTNEFPQATLTMVGADKDGSMEKVRNLVDQGEMKDRVNFTGYLSKAEWIAASQNHNFFINTSTADNMPVSVMEGMSLGLVVISTNVGGIPFLLEDGVDSFLVDSDDAHAMTDRITRVAQDPQLGIRLTKAARQKSETFSWDVVKEQWLLCIRQFEKKR